MGRAWKAKGFTSSNRLSILGAGLALENVWAVVNWFKEALSRKMEPETFSPIEIAIFHSSKGGLRARVTEHLHPNLVFTKPLGPANSFWAVESSLYPPPPPYGDVTRKGLGIKALSIFLFTCCLPLDIKSLVNKIPFLGTSSDKRGCYFSYPLSSFCQIEMRPLSRGKTTHVLHLSRVS